MLVLALLWCSHNPAPNHIAMCKQKDDLPDEKRRELESQIDKKTYFSIAFISLKGESTISPLADEDADDFDWPDLIDG